MFVSLVLCLIDVILLIVPFRGILIQKVTIILVSDYSEGFNWLQEHLVVNTLHEDLMFSIFHAIG